MEAAVYSTRGYMKWHINRYIYDNLNLRYVNGGRKLGIWIRIMRRK